MARLSLLLACLLAQSAAAKTFPSSPFSDGAAGTTAAGFLKQSGSARAEALGGSYAAAADTSDSIFWNPAGLARMEAAGKSEVSFGYGSLLETSYAGALAYARPLSDGRGVLGASFSYFSQSEIQGYDRFGNQDSSFKPTDFALGAAYARKISRLLVGGGIKLIRSSLADVSGTGFALDLGVQAERVADIGEGALDLGASLTNFGPPMSVGGSSDPLPMTLRLGSLWHLTPRVSGLLDGHVPVDQSPFVTLGVEGLVPVRDAVAIKLRAGFNTRNTRDIEGLRGVTAGFGVDADRMRLDYAWVPFGDLGTTHRFTVGVRF